MRSAEPAAAELTDAALLKALGEKHIPGLPTNLRILLLGQTAADDGGGAAASETVLEHVIRSDTQRELAMKDAAGRNLRRQAELR